MRNALWVLGLLLAGGALAEPDTFGLGTGRSGPLQVTALDTVINRYAQLTAGAAAGTKELTVSDSSGFLAGDLVLLHHSTGLTPAPESGDQRRLSLHSSTVGRFEYGRVEAVSLGGLRLTAPLMNGYPASGTQVVSVPEHTDVEVLAGASLRAAPWDGRAGGILALLATGTLTNSGLVSVDGAGFRGGVFLNHAILNGCEGLDEPVASGGSYKGEGLVDGRYGTASGRGNVANAGGGGNCHNSGGGGGGHAGMGGKGGLSSDAERDVGGMGGAAVAYLPYERIVFGGGGGAGEGNDAFGTSGGAGGGVMLLRAGEVAGAGRFSARGLSVGPTTQGGDDGAGGGGAGGAISLRSAGGLACGAAEASGGAGGDTVHPTYLMGPGGGGGGGFVFLQGEPLSCPVSVLAGPPGRSTSTSDSRGAGPASTDGGSAYGSDPSIPIALRTPAVPTVTQPASGAVGVAPRPRVEGVAEPGVMVHLFLDGAPYVRLAAGGTLGDFAYGAVADLSPGPHELRASAEVFGIRSPLSEPSRFDVTAPADGGVPDGGVSDGGVSDGGVSDGGVSDGGIGGGPIVVSPAEGEQVDPTPLVAGTSASGISISIQVDGVEVARVPLDEAGRFYYTLTAAQALAPGGHSVTAQAWEALDNPGLSSRTTTFEVLSPAELDVACGCGSSPGVGLGAVALLLAAGLVRRRHWGDGLSGLDERGTGL